MALLYDGQHSLISYAAKRHYIEGTDETGEQSQEFLHLLKGQRRGMFFKIAPDREAELNLWELTVFKFAGEYLEQVVNTLKRGAAVKRPILSRLVKGLNRVEQIQVQPAVAASFRHSRGWIRQATGQPKKV